MPGRPKDDVPIQCKKQQVAEDDEESDAIEYDETNFNEVVVEKKPETFLISDVELEEFQKLQEFVNETTTHYFGMPKFKLKSFTEFFEDGVTHRIKVQSNEKIKEIIGFAEIITCLPLEGLLPESWVRYFDTHFCITESLHFADTVFIKHLSYHQDHADKVFFEILNEVFHRELRIRNIVALEMPQMNYFKKHHYPDYTPMRKYSKVFYPKVYSVQHWNIPKVHVNCRPTFIETMIYRKAVTEDNDDLVEIVDQDYPEVRQQLGDYYIAEEIMDNQKKEEPSSTILCVEIDNVTSGFMWFNSNLDIEYLIKNYEVESFGFLIKVNQQAPLNQLKIITYTNQDLLDLSIFAQSNMQNLLNKLERDSDTCPFKKNASKPVVSENDLSGRGLEARFKRLAKYMKSFEIITKTILNITNFSNLVEKKVTINYNVTEEVDDISTNSNAFAIQLFGLGKEVDVRRGFRVLVSAFSLYKNRDYCLLSIPTTFRASSSTDELLKNFIPVQPRTGSTAADRLYITHRSAIHGSIKVQPVRLEDVTAVELCMHPTLNEFTTKETTFGKSVYIEVDILREILRDVLYNPHTFFTFLTIRIGNCLKPEVPWAIVGFVVLRQFSRTYFLKKQFRLQPKEDISKVRCEIVTLVLHPLYHCMSDELFREIARYMNIWHFYFFIPLKSLKRPLKNDLVNYMQPLEPQPIKKAWFLAPKGITLNDMDAPSKIGSLDLLSDYYAVFQRSLLPTKVFTSPYRIVIYGFTDVCRAFLRLIIFMWKSYTHRHVQSFTCVTRVDVTVLEPPGIIDCEFDSDFHCDTCKDPKHCWTNLQNSNSFIRDATHRLDLRIWIQFIHAHVKRIDRANKIVYSMDNCKYNYDIFLFMSHKKYGFTIPLRPTKLPYNYAQINNRLDKIQLYYKLKLMVDSPNPTDFKIVIYGPYITPFECINFLLNHKIVASQIILVIPYMRDAELHDKFNIPHSDTKIEYKLQTLAEEMGIKLEENYELVDVTYYKNNTHIAVLHFEHYFKKTRLSIQTDFFINYYTVNLDQKTMNICKTSGIHTEDDYILVNEKFQTNDPSIYAVGDYIKHVKEPNNQYRWVAPREIAEKLMGYIKLGFFKPHSSIIKDKYYYNHLFQAVVLKNIQYVKVTSPKRYLKNRPTNEYTSILRTSSNQTTCRVRLNGDGIVEEIVVLTLKEKNYDFLQFFCGKHESLLNDLQGRYCCGEIPCLLEFFSQPWTELIAHDYFIYEVHDPIQDIILGYLRRTFDFNTSRCERLQQLEKDIPPTRLEQIVVSFLRKYRYDFDYTFALREDFPTESLQTNG